MMTFPIYGKIEHVPVTTNQFWFTLPNLKMRPHMTQRTPAESRANLELLELFGGLILGERDLLAYD